MDRQIIEDSSGLQHKALDELDRETVMGYDSCGRRTSVAALGKTASETYDRSMALGGMDYALDAIGRRVDYRYYDDGQREQSILAIGTPEQAVTTYFYDDDHNLIQTTDPVGMVTSLTYDKLGRRDSVTVPGTQNLGSLHFNIYGGFRLWEAVGWVTGGH